MGCQMIGITGRKAQSIWTIPKNRIKEKSAYNTIFVMQIVSKELEKMFNSFAVQLLLSTLVDTIFKFITII